MSHKASPLEALIASKPFLYQLVHKVPPPVATPPAQPQAPARGIRREAPKAKPVPNAASIRTFRSNRAPAAVPPVVAKAPVAEPVPQPVPTAEPRSFAKIEAPPPVLDQGASIAKLKFVAEASAKVVEEAPEPVQPPPQVIVMQPRARRVKAEPDPAPEAALAVPEVPVIIQRRAMLANAAAIRSAAAVRAVVVAPPPKRKECGCRRRRTTAQ